jgi:cysteinyl-tRNA synthetase
MFAILGLNITYVKMTEEDLDLYQQYMTSKAEKDFQKSDEIRQILISKGIM